MDILTQKVRDIANDLTSYDQDLLEVKDFSAQLWKKHTIRVSSDLDTTTSKELAKDFLYKDIWAKDMQIWLSRTALGDKKILIIHNIERININAANALLKSLEEPQDWCLIIATISHPSHMLETLRSRAFLMPLGWISLTSDELALRHNLTEDFSQRKKAQHTTDKYTLLLSLQKKKQLTAFLELLMYYYGESHMYDRIAKVATLTNQLNAHVNAQAALMNFAM